MQTRQGVLEIFSTFLQFDTEWVSRWISDPRLRRSMQHCLSQSPESSVSAQFWAIYWHKIWQIQSSPTASAHLTAYLQEASYWTAKKMMMNFASNQSLMDLFQITLTKIDKVLEKFDPQQGVQLQKYASLVFKSIIKDELRLRHEVDICTDWALLYKISQKKLIEALQNRGLKPEILEDYLLAWKCFKTIYTPTEARNTRKMPEPELEMWQAMAKLHNIQPANPVHLKQSLEICALVARNYLYPKFVSVDVPKPGQEQRTFLDDLPATVQESLLGEIIAQEEAAERKQKRSQINAVLLKSLVKLDIPSQTLLQMYYGGELTQQQIAQQLEIKQYTVSRRLASLRQSLLLTLAQWSQTHLHQSLNTDVLNRMSVVLEEWLKVHYHAADPS